uniref:Ionotropic glutamate receptor C-terminal domain-containing protein n=1 Tax=Megaselia scalaris TaxID=36166 RepID=T1GBD5_MEGSC
MATGLQLILDLALCVGTLCPPDSTSLSEGNPNDFASIQPPSNKAIFEMLRSNINGSHLKVATLEDYPLSYTEKNNVTDFEKSLIEMVNKSEVDVAAAFVPLLADPRNFTFYSTTALDEGEWIMVMTRPKESATGSGLLAPFDKWVWVLIFVSLVCVGPIIYALILLRNKCTGDDIQKPYSLGHCAWFVYGALLKQGSTLSPIADSTRLLFATWWIFITILTSFYTANLTAFLTLSKFTLPFNTYKDILKAQKQFVTSRGGGVEYAIRNV